MPLGSSVAGGLKEYSTGMLVVESVVPGGPTDRVLEPGDTLVRGPLSAGRALEPGSCP